MITITKPIRKTIMVDMDNTINRLSDYFIEKAIESGFLVKPNIKDSYDLNAGLISPITNPVDYIFNLPHFWFNIPIMTGADDFITYQLHHQNYNVLFVTTPYENCLTCKPEKIEWLKKYFNWVTDQNIIFADKKWEFESLGDLIIEDKPETLMKWSKFKFKVLHKYNDDITCDFTIYDWQNQSEELSKKIKELLK
jgi:5'(3')-deoxyribonucleotidase